MERRAIEVCGLVQGVGFRPFVYHLADRLELRGFVRNQTGRVLIEVEGDPPSLERFLTELVENPPPLAHIERLQWEQREPLGDGRFQIAESEAGDQRQLFISPDIATCSECLAELLDPADRRSGYPFLNCTNCGPRLTIITGAPYDRHRTTMAGFVMCAQCRAEYEDPTNRRFHAQPTACPACGPELKLLDAGGQPVAADKPLGQFAEALCQGRIGALKGLGGYHLVCDASSTSAVSELRRRKGRDEKPFAIMAPDIEAAAVLAEIAPEEQSLLLSPERPIVLLRKRLPEVVAPQVAPGNPYLGVMLPYTPLHHLLMRAAGGRLLVMTSGNRSDEPIGYQENAPERLAGIADLFLAHNRSIHVRCDDSVVRIVDGTVLPIRRSRGYAPRPIELPFSCPRPLLAVGGQLKVTFALGCERRALLSHHLGDLDHYEAYQAFTHDVALYQQLFAVTPEQLVHDLHPDYSTTRYAQKRAADGRIELLGVQHHHAHVASCMAENHLTGPVIGIAFDGTGFGTDGAIWGGEVLIADYRSFRRAAHLRYVGMPGGDRAIKEPWRMAAAHLIDAGLEPESLLALDLHKHIPNIRQMLARRFHAPWTSSLGRLFDSIAVLARVRNRVSYEGQAAMELESLAMQAQPDEAYPIEIEAGPSVEGLADAPLIIDTRPLIRAVASDSARAVPKALIARRFHSTVIELVSEVCGRLRHQTQINQVALSGGVFLNVLLTRELTQRLEHGGFRVYRHSVVPPNDGGLSLGQLAIAAARCQ